MKRDSSKVEGFHGGHSHLALWCLAERQLENGLHRRVRRAPPVFVVDVKFSGFRGVDLLVGPQPAPPKTPPVLFYLANVPDFGAFDAALGRLLHRRSLRNRNGGGRPADLPGRFHGGDVVPHAEIVGFRDPSPRRIAGHSFSIRRARGRIVPVRRPPSRHRQISLGRRRRHHAIRVPGNPHANRDGRQRHEDRSLTLETRRSKLTRQKSSRDAEIPHLVALTSV